MSRHQLQSSDPACGTAFKTLEQAIQALATQSHFQAGERVVIFQLGLFRCPQIEGLATVTAAVPSQPGWFYVLFEGDHRLRRRIVLPGVFQTAPDATLATLLTAWRAGVSPPLLQEFFVGETGADNDNGREG